MSPKSRILALTVAVSILLILCATYFVYGHDEDVIFEIEESDDGILRYVTVTGDYKFDEYAKNGSHELDLSDFYAFLAENVTDGKTINGVNPANCSAFTISKTDSDGYLAGRNFDFRHVEPGVVYTDPDNGYASVSVVDLRMFSDTGSSLEDMRSDSRLNAVPYIPLDGMNEKGVFVAINSVHKGPSMTMDRPENVPIFTTSAMRLILDNAASTQEAVDLVSKYNFRSQSCFHIFVCDNTGDSRCIEVIGKDRHITETSIVTNHYLTEDGKRFAIDPSSLIRFTTLIASVALVESMTTDEAMGTLETVKQENPDQTHYTRWSVVYDLDSLTATLCTNGADGKMDYSVSYSLAVQTEG